MCTSPKEISPVCGSHTQRPPPTLVGIALGKLPRSSCLYPVHSHTPHPHPEPLSCLASPSEGFRESELTSSCAWSLWTVSPDSNGFAFSPWCSGAQHTASHKGGAQQVLVACWSPSSSSKPPFPPLPSPNRLQASQTSCVSCGMPVYCFPPDPS